MLSRHTLKFPFSLANSPDWPCPTCRSGVLRIHKGTFNKQEATLSRDHSHVAWEPAWIQYVYACLLVCTNDRCREVVANAGTGSVEAFIGEGDEGDPHEEYIDTFRPTHFEPPLRLMTIPDECPESVSTALKESFRTFFSSPSSASNAVRTAIEELLSELKVKRVSNTGGRRRFVSLHQRIALLPTKYAQLKDLLLAVKWLGNAGSHGGGEGKGTITMDDVMDSYELMEHRLHEIFAPKAKKLRALAKNVNRKKGPSRSRG
jgi:hypothetical protein